MIRIAAIILASDSAITLARFRPSKLLKYSKIRLRSEDLMRVAQEEAIGVS